MAGLWFDAMQRATAPAAPPLVTAQPPISGPPPVAGAPPPTDTPALVPAERR